MKNKIIVAVIALVFLLGLLTIIKIASAKQPDVKECCVEEDIEITIDLPATPTKSSRSGGYMKPIVKPVMVYDVVKYGSMGQAVKDFQMFLNNKGAKLVVDGIFGDLTQGAWLEFEKTLNLK